MEMAGLLTGLSDLARAETDSDDPLRVGTSQTLRQQIVERLREAIALGQLPPGTRLVDRDLCERMGVSRTSIREAMRELEAAGLITNQPHKGPVVTVVTLDMARSIYEIRAVMEGLAARLFARRASTAQVAAIKRAVDDLAAVYADFTPGAFLKAKTEFYRILLEGSQNQLAADMLRTIHTRVSQLRATSLSNPARAAQSIAEIREFVAALEARNEEAAWHTCVRHVENAARAALTVLAAQQQAAAAEAPPAKRARRP
jgi:GntR family transcriptional regulator, trigonelline degradation regulator